MNLQVDLLSEEERRGTAPARVNLLVRVAYSGLAIVFALLLAGTALATRTLRGEQARAQMRWREVAPAYEALKARRVHLQDVRARLAELQAFSNAHLRVAARLQALPGIVSPEVQLTSLRLSQAVVESETHVPERNYTLAISGRTSGTRADTNVRELLSGLSLEPFAPDVASVTPGGFRPDPAKGASPDQLVFELQCAFRPRRFE